MNPELPPLNPLRVFESTSRHLNIAAAAAELHITPSAVSHQLKALEAWLGFDLFDRSSRRLQLTEGGRIYASTLGGAFSRIVQATQDLVSGTSQQVLVLKGYTTFFVRWLVPRVTGFQRQHPDIKLRLKASIEAVDFRRDRAEAAILYGDGQWSGLHSTLLFHDALTPVVSPGLARKLGPPGSGRDLLSLPLLHLNRRPNHWRDWLEAAGETRAGPPAHDIAAEDLAIVYQNALEGMGVALGQLAYLEPELKQGTLVAPHPFVLRRPRGYYFVCPEETADETKIAAFRNWLRAQVRRRAAPRRRPSRSAA